MSDKQDDRISPEAIGGENFPVASKLLPEKWRQPLLDFYSFARGMDNISDSSTLKREAKRDQLRVIRLALQEDQPEMLPAWAQAYYQRVNNNELSGEHGEALWQAFWQDTEKRRYRSFEEVIAYCTLSAVPVGRAFLEITQEISADRQAADSLCIALQLINHWQDVRRDYLKRGRIYLPQNWMEAQGLSEKVLEKAESGPKLRKIFQQWSHEVDRYLTDASALPATIDHRGLRWEIRIILAYAKKLAKQLRKGDPMARRIRLTPFQQGWISILAILRLA